MRGEKQSEISRRNALKRLGAGAVGLTAGTTGLVGSVRNARALTIIVDNYPYEYTDTYTNTVYNSGAEYKRFYTYGVRMEHIDTMNGEATIGINIESDVSTRWKDQSQFSYDCTDIYQQEVGLSFNESDAEDINVREDKNWVGRHEYDGNDETYSWAMDSAEAFGGYCLDTLSNTLGTVYEQGMDTYEFLAKGYEAVIDQTDKKGFKWDYEGESNAFAYPGKKDAGSDMHFRVYVDSGQEIPLDIYNQINFFHETNKTLNQAFKIQSP